VTACLLGVAAGAFWALGPKRTAATAASPVRALASAGVETPNRAALAGPADGSWSPRGSERAFLEPVGAGRVAYDEGRLEDALEEFRRAIEEDPESVDAINDAAQVLVRLGRAGEALPLLQQAVNAAPSRWDLQFNLARALGEAGRWPEAASAYRAAAALKPGDVYTAFNLAQALDRANEPGALGELERVVALIPDEPSFHLALATASERRGDWGRARQAFAGYRALLAPGSAEAGKVDRHLTSLDARLHVEPPPPAPVK
jgi:tetratricopeptide (TPR) repeat protein